MPASAAAPHADPAQSFSNTLSLALSGDPVMIRQLLGTVGAFTVKLLVAALIFAITLWLAKRLSMVARASVKRLTPHHHGAAPADNALQDFIGGLVKYGVIGVGLIVVLQQLGVQATSVIAVLGAASLAIGLAIQGALSNVAAGVMILILRPYRIGERVELNGRSGTVKAMDLFNTHVVDYDGLTVFLPNGKVFGDMIVNISRQGRRRIELVFGIDYEDDVDLALRLLTEIASADRRVLSDPAPWARMTALGDSSVNLTLRCWASTDDWMNTKFDLTLAVKKRFEAEGLSFPYPHQVQVERADVAPAKVRERMAEGQAASPSA